MYYESLEDITYYKNLPDGAIFTPINYFYSRFNKEFIKKLIPGLKILLLDKFIELLDKYEYEIELWDLENYLGEEHNIANYDGIINVANANIKDKDVEWQKQLMYAYEYVNYGFELEEKVGLGNFNKKDIYEYINKKYPNFIDSNYNVNIYNDFYNNIVDNNEDMFGNRLNRIIRDFKVKTKIKD